MSSYKYQVFVKKSWICALYLKLVPAQILDCSNSLYPLCLKDAKSNICAASDPTTCDQEGPFYLDLTKTIKSTKSPGDAKTSDSSPFRRHVLVPTDWFSYHSNATESCAGATCSYSKDADSWNQKQASKPKLLILHGEVFLKDSSDSTKLKVTDENLYIDIWSAGQYDIAGEGMNGGYSGVDDITAKSIADSSKHYWFRGYTGLDSKNGTYSFLTQFPIIYGERPVRHVHMMVYYLNPDKNNEKTHILTTQVYFDDMVPNWNNLQNHGNQVVPFEKAKVRDVLNKDFVSKFNLEDSNIAKHASDFVKSGIGYDEKNVYTDEYVPYLDDEVYVAKFDIRLDQDAGVLANLNLKTNGTGVVDSGAEINFGVDDGKSEFLPLNHNVSENYNATNSTSFACNNFRIACGTSIFSFLMAWLAVI